MLALLRMAPDDVPAALRSRLAAVVTPIWSPKAGNEPATHTGPAGRGDPGRGDGPRGHPGVEVLVTANEPVDGTWLDRLPALRAVVLTGTASDDVDLARCRSRGIVVCNNPGYTGPAVAEHALALALAANRRLVEQDAGARAHPPRPAPLTRDLAGSTAGIVGLGDVGGRLAVLAAALGLRVIFTNRRRRVHPGAEQVSLPDLLDRADFVFLTLPLTPDTRHLLDEAAFARLRPGAYVINVSADELIDPVALAGALRSGRLAGAALDVIGSPGPYLGLPRLLLTTSSAWYTREGVRRRAEGWLTTVEACVAGHPRHVVT